MIQQGIASAAWHSFSHLKIETVEIGALPPRRMRPKRRNRRREIPIRQSAGDQAAQKQRYRMVAGRHGKVISGRNSKAVEGRSQQWQPSFRIAKSHRDRGKLRSFIVQEEN